MNVKVQIVGMLNKDKAFGTELLKLRRKIALANSNTEGLQETNKLAGLSLLAYFNFLIVFILSP